MSKQVYPVNQLRVFINTINDLSADILLQEDDEALPQYRKDSLRNREKRSQPCNLFCSLEYLLWGFFCDFFVKKSPKKL